MGKSVQLINLRSQEARRDGMGHVRPSRDERKNSLIAYLFRRSVLLVHDEHGRGDSIVGIHNWHNVQAYQLGQSTEQILSRLLVVKVRLGDQNLDSGGSELRGC